ncbi:N, N'-diacetylbacillosaminyl-diphospho-undecaprenol alpha-1,3-N-acetylgalactosaminyltransferase [bacterium BMS3Bbin04]|nr:N, N'-diacetylbacillosaminyl-diphospho-undecaprenol alpha-1,3-N-acetylgalactosaminyltransferase [bacterium BMS3Bbin04]
MSSNRCRILIFTQNDWFFHLHFMHLGSALVEDGHEVILTCNVDKHQDAIEAIGINVHPLQRLRVSSLDVRDQLLFLVEFYQLVRELKPDVAIFLSPKPILLGSFVARLAAVPAFLSIVTGLGFLFLGQGGRYALLQRIVMGIWKWTHSLDRSRMLFENRTDREFLIESGVVPAHRAVLIGGEGTDLDLFHPGKRENDVPVIVFGARMIREKGVEVLVEAARILRKQQVPYRVLLCGSPDPGNPSTLTAEELTGYAEEGVVEWLGHVDNFAELLATADIGCLPTYYREGMPKFLMDAAAAGLPLVTTNAPGCEDVVEHGVNGFIVPKRDAVSLAEALAVLLQNPEKRIAMGKASRERAEAEFSHDKYANNVMAALADVL